MSNSSEVDGGGKRRIDLGEDDAEIDELFDYGNNYEKDDDSTVDNNASSRMCWGNFTHLAKHFSTITV